MGPLGWVESVWMHEIGDDWRRGSDPDPDPDPDPDSFSLILSMKTHTHTPALLVVDVTIGRLLDAGKSYPGTILPMLLCLALVALVASALQVRLLLLQQQRRKRNAVQAGGGGGGGGGVDDEEKAQYPALLSPSTGGAGGLGDVETASLPSSSSG